MTFHDLKIGDIFHVGKFDNRGEMQYHVYRKMDKSHAICIEQHGYGNQRAVGHTNPFHAVSRVWLIVEGV